VCFLAEADADDGNNWSSAVQERIYAQYGSLVLGDDAREGDAVMTLPQSLRFFWQHRRDPENNWRVLAIILLAFALSGMLAGVAGVLWISRTATVTPTTGATPILVAFVAVVLGGLGSTVGAVVGGFAFGILQVFLEAYLPSGVVPFQFAFALIAVSVVLFARPQGLLGKTVEVKV
jgi:hypothetical protein